MTDPHELIALMLPDSGGFHIAEWLDQAHWVPVGDAGALTWLMRSTAAYEGDLTLSACPYLEQGSRLIQANGGAFWVRCETGDSVKRLASFKPSPTLVLQEGKTNRLTAFWALCGGLSPEDLERGNRRLSYALNTPAWACEPSFRFHPPGTVIRKDRRRPIAVHVAEQSDELYPVTITKPLKDRPKPDPEKWRK